jgi:hypothetical protein
MDAHPSAKLRAGSFENRERCGSLSRGWCQRKSKVGQPASEYEKSDHRQAFQFQRIFPPELLFLQIVKLNADEGNKLIPKQSHVN